MAWIVVCSVCGERMIVANQADPGQAHWIGDVKCSGSSQSGKSGRPIE